MLVSKRPRVLGLGEHEAGKVVSDGGLERRYVRVAVVVGRDGHDLEAGHGRRGGVGAVSAVWDEHLRASGVAVGEVVGPRHEHPGELAFGAGHGRQGGACHAGHLGEEPLKLVHQLQGALHAGLRLTRMHLGHTRHARHLVVQLGVVLHRTASKGIEVVVDGEVGLAHLGEVSDDLSLADLRHGQVVPEQLRWRRFLLGHVERRQGVAHPARHAPLHEQPPVQYLQVLLRCGGHVLATSASAAARLSISSFVFISVQQTSIPLGTCSLTSSPPMILRSNRASLISATGLGHSTTNSRK